MSAYSKNVHDSILNFVGNTPLIKLNKIPKEHGLKCQIYAKCEFMNPGGSIKDRIAKAMTDDAIKGGFVKKNSEFVEATSGNTGIGIALNATLIDKKCTIIINEKNSLEKQNTMRVLGAEIIQTKTSAGQIARDIKDAHPDTVLILDQFENGVNPRIHYDTTGKELIEALDSIDYLVLGAGTGGTLSGTGVRVKEKYPKCVLIVAEPDGSTMFNEHGKKHPFLIEGIGGSEVPIVLDKSLVDGYEVVTDEEAFVMARQIIKKEGLLCGGSSGAAMAAAVKVASKMNLGPDKIVVVILPDGIRNYMSGFVNDQWMEAHLFKDPPEHTMRWWKEPITKLPLSDKFPKVDKECTCAKAIRVMAGNNIAVVVDKNGFLIGAVTKDNIRREATNPIKLPDKDSEEFDFNDVVANHLIKDCYSLAQNEKKKMPTIGLLSRMLDMTPFVVIGVNKIEQGDAHFLPKGIATANDVLEYISST